VSGVFTTTSREVVALLAPIAASASVSRVAENAALSQSARDRPGLSKPAAIAVATNPAELAALSSNLRVAFIRFPR